MDPKASVLPTTPQRLSNIQTLMAYTTVISGRQKMSVNSKWRLENRMYTRSQEIHVSQLQARIIFTLNSKPFSVINPILLLSLFSPTPVDSVVP